MAEVTRSFGDVRHAYQAALSGNRAALRLIHIVALSRALGMMKARRGQRLRAERGRGKGPAIRAQYDPAIKLLIEMGKEASMGVRSGRVEIEPGRKSEHADS